MADTSSWQPSETVVFSELGDTIALLDTERNVYYSLEGIGSFLWDHLRQGSDFAGLCRAVTDHFDVDMGTVKADVAEWIASMAASGLIDERRA